MNRPPLLALVASGPTRHNVVARLPRLAQLLGPVKAPDLRIASRIANSLRAGWAARTWQELADAQIVIICVSSPRLYPRIVAEMAAVPDIWRGKTILAADAPLGRQALAPLVCQGAETASLIAMDLIPPSFILDADRRAGLRIRRLIREAGGKTMEASEQAYCHVARLMDQHLPELFQDAVDILRQSGLEPGEARRLVEVQFHQTLRSYLRGGRAVRRERRWQQPVGIPAD